MHFALIVSILIAGHWHEFVMDSGLTAEDCAAAIVALPDPFEHASCELEGIRFVERNP